MKDIKVLNNIILQDNATVVTLKGMITPFLDQSYDNYQPLINLWGNDSKYDIPEYFFNDGLNMFKQILSLRAGENISDDDLFLDRFDGSPYLIKDLNQFLKSLVKVVKYREISYVVRGRNGEIIVMGYDDLPYFNRRRGKNPKWKVYSYLSDDKREMDLIFKYLRAGVAPAVVECIVVSDRYKRNGEPMYDIFRKKTKSKVREICAPKPDLKRALRHLLQPLNKAYDMKLSNSNQFAYTIGRSVKDNAKLHRQYEYTMKCDIKQFFDHCNWGLVSRYLKFLYRDVSYNEFVEIESYLKEMLINPRTGGLYLGSPASGPLTNAILRPSAKYLTNIFSLDGLEFSVYADDLTISSHEPIDVANVLGKIRYVFEYFNLPFKLNPEKTKIFSGHKRMITGVRINHNHELTLDRSLYRLLRSVLHRLANNQEVTMTKGQLAGNLGYALFIDDSGKMEKLVTQYYSTLKKHGITFSKIESKMGKQEDNIA